MAMQVPASLKSGHDALYAGLKRAVREPGRTGDAARKVLQVMDGHMMREEKFALRPLGLLKALARGETPAELADAADLVEGLKREMPQMIEEHRQISDLLRQLAREAHAEDRPEYVALAEEIIIHAHIEEDVLYPAALLIGEYAKKVRR
jgi:hypothetical protein